MPPKVQQLLREHRAKQVKKPDRKVNFTEIEQGDGEEEDNFFDAAEEEGEQEESEDEGNDQLLAYITKQSKFTKKPLGNVNKLMKSTHNKKKPTKKQAKTAK